MKKFSLILILFLLFGCSPKILPSTSTIYNYKDSIRIIDSIVYAEIPKERIIDCVVQYDTSYLETSVSYSTAYVDTTTHMLKHSLFNKQDSIPIKIQYKDRIIQKDSIITKEIPYRVETIKYRYNTFFYILLSYFIISVCIFIVILYMKFR